MHRGVLDHGVPERDCPRHHVSPFPRRASSAGAGVHTVRRERADVGIGLDGDGDRLGVIDDRGQIIWGDLLMILFWREILPRYPNTIGIVEVKCSQALYDEIQRLGGRPVFYRTGHSLIKAKMRDVGAVFAGEMSGHMFFADEYYGYDDAVYAAARLLRLLSFSDRRLSVMLADVPRYHATPETRVACPDAIKFDVVARVAQAFRRTHEVIDVDGARVVFPDGWGLVRASNTEPALVLRAESRTPEGLELIKRVLADALAHQGRMARVSW